MASRDGLLYLPASDSDIDFLEATCLDSDYVLSCMRACGSRHQVLLVDGCHAGAFFVNNRGIPDGFCSIMACEPEDLSYGDAAGGHFTRLLVEGLRGARAQMPTAMASSPPTNCSSMSASAPQSEVTHIAPIRNCGPGTCRGRSRPSPCACVCS